MTPGGRRYVRVPRRSRERVAAEVREEIEFHLSMRTAELVSGGLAEAEARLIAEAEFGDRVVAEESLQQADLGEERRRGTAGWLEDLARDAGFALRGLRRTPGWTAVAAGTIAIGVGVAAAAAGALEGVLNRPLGVAVPEELYVLWTENVRRGVEQAPVEYRELVALAEVTRAIGGIAAYEYNEPAEAVVRLEQGTVLSRGSRVTGSFFPLVGAVPAAGRVILPSDDVVGGEPVAVLSHGFWLRHFGGDGGALGQRLSWANNTYTIVGVLPPEFAYPNGAEFWTSVLSDYPALLDPSAPPEASTHFYLVARSAPGRGGAEVEAEFGSFLEATDESRMEAIRGGTAVVTPWRDAVVGELRAPLLALTLAGSLILLLACVNVGGLLLIRASQRVRELSIRAALGAGRGRIIRQLVVEATLLAALGGIGGLALAHLLLRAARWAAPAEFVRLGPTGIDARVVALALGATLVTAVVAGVGSALLGSGRATARTLRSTGRAAGDRRSRNAREWILVAQIATAMLLVVAAGVTFRTLRSLQALELGFVADRLVIGQLSLPPDRLGSREEQLALVEAAVERVRGVPGVRAAAVMPVRPFSGTGGWDAPFVGEGQSVEEASANPWLNLELITDDYFEALGARLLRGRDFDRGDVEGALPVAIVSRSVADRLWPGQDPLGRRLKIGDHDAPTEWAAVVGVVADLRYREFEEPRPSLYLPIRQLATPVPMGMAVRTTGAPDGVLPSIGAALAEIDGELMLATPRTVPDLLAVPLAGPRFAVTLLGIFATVALLLAGIGLYGAMAAMVRERHGEMGVRLALGALPADILRSTMGRGLLLGASGLILGALLSLLGARPLRARVYETGPIEPVTLVVPALLLLLVVLVACWNPAWRASRTDPLAVLRAD